MAERIESKSAASMTACASTLKYGARKRNGVQGTSVSITMKTICSTVFHLPSASAAITTPFFAATSRNPEITNSRPMNRIAAIGCRWPKAESRIIAEQVNSLSAIGSMNFPKSVTRLRLRAMFPSSESVIAASTKMIAAIQCETSSETPNHAGR